MSGDDLHRWERGHDSWSFYTHYHPDANNLELGYRQICDLMSGRSVYRQEYNHHTGKFDEPRIVHPKPVIIYEGLHALYHEQTANRARVKVFVRTDSDLLMEWKVSRDVRDRGYDPQKVRQSVWRRKLDESLFIGPQESRANVVINFRKVKELPGRCVMDFHTFGVRNRILCWKLWSLWNNEDLGSYGG